MKALRKIPCHYCRRVGETGTGHPAYDCDNPGECLHDMKYPCNDIPKKGTADKKCRDCYYSKYCKFEPQRPYNPDGRCNLWKQGLDALPGFMVK